MRKIFLSAAFVLFMAAACSPEYIVNPEEYVSTLVGSDSDFSFSNGNTYPAIALPWGMNFWTPQTGEKGNGWQYTYGAHVLRAFKQTHQPSPWINDYGCFSIMPVNRISGPVESVFSHKSGEKVHLRVASSFISDEQAERLSSNRCSIPYLRRHQFTTIPITAIAFTKSPK
jgi:putative alpha-1,2-mannosidase